MSTPNRSLPGQDEQRPSFLSGSAASPQSAAPSVSSHPGAGRASSGASSLETQHAAIQSILFTDHEQFEALSSEIQQKVLAAFDWLLLSPETQDSLGAKQRAKQAEANARQAEADWLAKAIRSIEEADQDAISFLHSVLLSDDGEPGSPGMDSDAN
ncbi:hypothetical protein CTAM01_16900 [Colletotrichum tamarilloi]|uniref:Uncharacterized protein n=1 Tax=Colletotrichum tamarilloi TaxID=1209934 RepID=A0ABQ9QH60_9PEZI|nr:uncharacterized protein CTAM01_16900 [Colletotrichum tamarilloi]KAK1470221.1 hypothetical protein CTAM01_16900 [Colletotrichum tamarilloi]